MTCQVICPLVAVIVAACSATSGPSDKREPDDSQIAKIAIVADWPEKLNPLGERYPSPGDPCRRLGESTETSKYLDDSADLVGCPAANLANGLGGKIVGTVEGISIVSVPRGDANAGMAAAAASAAKPRDIIRGKGGLERNAGIGWPTSPARP